MEKDHSECLFGCVPFLLQVSDNQRDSTVFGGLLRHQTIWFYIKDREDWPQKLESTPESQASIAPRTS